MGDINEWLLVKTLVTGRMDPGLYFVQWDGRDEAGHAVASGVYFCRLEVAGQTAVEKMVLLR